MKKQFILLAFVVLIFGCKNVEENPDTSSKTKESSILNAQIANGKALFSYYCRGCHNVNLRKKSTASALGNITKCRTEEYLFNITKNFMKVVTSGNEAANCTFNAFNQNVMIPFENLSDEQIKNIYRFIENESIIQKIEDDEIQHETSCYTDKNGSVVSLDQNGNQIINHNDGQDTIQAIKAEIDIEYFEKEFFNEFYFKKYKQIKDIYTDRQKQVDVSKFRLEIKEAGHIFLRHFSFDETNQTSINLKLYYTDEGFKFYFHGTEDYEEIFVYDETEELTFLFIEESAAEERLFGRITIPIKNINQTHQLQLEKLTKSQIQAIINQ